MVFVIKMNSFKSLFIPFTHRFSNNFYNCFLQFLFQNVIFSCRVKVIQKLFFSLFEFWLRTSSNAFFLNFIFEHLKIFICDWFNCKFKLPSKIFFGVLGWGNFRGCLSLGYELMGFWLMNKVFFSRYESWR